MARAVTHAAAKDFEHLSQQVRGEYLEMPGMSLTVEQATKMWGINREICATLLESLVEVGFLRRGQHGMYLLGASSKPEQH